MTVKDINAKQLGKWYMSGKWSAEMCAEAKEKGYITEDELQKILKLPVKNQA